MKPSAGATARLDPWLVFCRRFGDYGRAPAALFLFGYALHHHRLLGQSWVRTSPVLALRPDAGRALTASGSRYALGRPVASPHELDQEGRVAWDALVRGAAGGLERRWLGARKAARWLGVEAPALEEEAVAAFEAEHLPRNLAWRAGLADRQGSA